MVTSVPTLLSKFPTSPSTGSRTGSSKPSAPESAAGSKRPRTKSSKLETNPRIKFKRPPTTLLSRDPRPDTLPNNGSNTPFKRFITVESTGERLFTKPETVESIVLTVDDIKSDNSVVRPFSCKSFTRSVTDDNNSSVTSVMDLRRARKLKILNVSLIFRFQ